MSAPINIAVSESVEELKSVLSKTTDYLKPRVRMLLHITRGLHISGGLAAKTGLSIPTILSYKKKYAAGGLEALLKESRGGDKRSGLSTDQKALIKTKLSDPKNGLRSYVEMQAWLKAELGIEKEYHALNKYLKRNFGTKLKVGRKSHVKKDEAAVAVFKKSARSR
jgi:transposase